MENEKALKHIYDLKLLEQMGAALVSAYPDFNLNDFLNLKTKLLQLEMKPRVLLIRDEIYRQLPSDYSTALNILMKSVEHGKLSGFMLWPYTEFVQTYGIEKTKDSLLALKELTKLFTSEWGVRPFIIKDTDQTLKFMLACANDKNVHVRRWASEGTRPRIPWGERLHIFIKNPKPVLQILEQLRFDDELYVRKSVANNLNDIAKDHPDLVVKTLKRWKKEAPKEQQKNIEWITKHALRTLIKEGHAGALSAIGVSSKVEVQVLDLSISKKLVKLGEEFTFSFEIKSKAKKSQNLVIDYIIDFVKSNGETAPKVFKLKNLKLAAGEKVTVSKKHPMKKVTTRTYYSGTHRLSIQVNGKNFDGVNWKLKV